MANDIIRDKIRESMKVLASKKTVSSEIVEMVYVPVDGYKKDNTPPCENAGWKNLERHTVFEGQDKHYWLHTKIKAPTLCENQELRFTVKTGKEGLWDATNPQFTVFVDGVTTQALDTNHTWFPLKGDKEYDIYLYLYTGMIHNASDVVYNVPEIVFNVVATLEIVDLKIESLWYDIKIPYDCLKNINENSVDYYTIQNHLNKATMLLDLRDFYSSDFYNSIDATSKYLKEEFYEKECGNNKGIVNCIGHTHIDVAWLWTVAQTREKAQRSFSTVINMMKYFDDYKFMSSQPQLYQHVKEQDSVLYEEIKKRVKEGREIVEDKKQSIISSLKTDGGLFVYNPSPFEVSDYVEVDGKTVYAKNIPAHGFKVVEEKYVDTGVSVSEKCIENDVVKVVFNDKYHIISVYDKAEDREVLAENAEANVIEMFEDYPRNYDAWEITEYYKHKMWIADDVSSVELLKNGLRIKRKYQKSEIVQDIILRKGSKRIDFVTTVDWHEDHTLMKASFPVDIPNTVATYDIQFGNIERPTYANTSWDGAKFEVCAHKWADLSESNYGVSILNDCKYGYSTEENIMKISLLKSATYPYKNADREMHSFTYSLFPHYGDFRKGGVVQEGYALNIPLEVCRIDAQNGTNADTYSLVDINSENVIIETIKKAEDDNSVIVRLYESYNQKSDVTVTSNFDFNEVYLCDLMENNIEKLPHNGKDVELKVKNFEIVTLKFITGE